MKRWLQRQYRGDLRQMLYIITATLLGIIAILDLIHTVTERIASLIILAIVLAFVLQTLRKNGDV